MTIPVVNSEGESNRFPLVNPARTSFVELIVDELQISRFKNCFARKRRVANLSGSDRPSRRGSGAATWPPAARIGSPEQFVKRIEPSLHGEASDTSTKSVSKKLEIACQPADHPMDHRHVMNAVAISVVRS